MYVKCPLKDAVDHGLVVNVCCSSLYPAGIPRLYKEKYDRQLSIPVTKILVVKINKVGHEAVQFALHLTAHSAVPRNCVLIVGTIGRRLENENTTSSLDFGGGTTELLRWSY